MLLFTIGILNRFCQRWVFRAIGLFCLAVVAWDTWDLFHKARSIADWFGYDTLTCQFTNIVLHAMWGLAFLITGEYADKIRQHLIRNLIENWSQ
jgi:hypothetical protein